MRMEIHRGSRRMALLIRNLLARSGWAVNAAPGPLYHGQSPGTYFIGRWMGPTAGLKKRKSLAPNGV